MKNDRQCPVCGVPSTEATLFMAENINNKKLSEFSFSSRKTPEFMSHRLVACSQCDLVYAPQPPEGGELAAAYHQANYDSSLEADDAAQAYTQAIEPILLMLSQRDSVLEIGTGTGVFLQRMEQAGFSALVGVEPSTAAITAARPEQRAWIRQGVFEESAFAADTFDLICCFMTMEHVSDPTTVAHSAFKLLRPGGAFVTVTHDRRSIVNRLLGKRSPIIDVEHMQLFSDASLITLFKRTGYEHIEVKAFSNRYALHYWLRLTPLPTFLKNLILKVLARMRCDSYKLSLNVGNTMGVGFKPL